MFCTTTTEYVLTTISHYEDYLNPGKFLSIDASLGNFDSSIMALEEKYNHKLSDSLFSWHQNENEDPWRKFSNDEILFIQNIN